MLFSAEQVSMNFSQSFRHFPTETRATGSPTTATRDCARVMAVFKSLADDKNLEVKKLRILSRVKISKDAAKVCSHTVGKKKSQEKLLKQFAKFASKM